MCRRIGHFRVANYGQLEVLQVFKSPAESLNAGSTILTSSDRLFSKGNAGRHLLAKP